MFLHEIEDQPRESSNYVQSSVAALRLDGHNFGRFTKNLGVFDTDFTEAMVESAKSLCDFLGSDMFYVGSDEVTFILGRGRDGSMNYGGRKDKLLSLSTAQMTSQMMRQVMLRGMDVPIDPLFDSRIFETEEVGMLISSRISSVHSNAISTAAWDTFGHRKTTGKTEREKVEMLGGTDGIPEAELWGTLGQRVAVQQPLEESVRQSIPEHERPAPGTLVTRKKWLLTHPVV